YDGNVIKNTSAIVIPDSEETLMHAKESHFVTRIVPQTELSTEQAFWSKNSVNSPEPTLSSKPTKVEVPKELPKVSMVNTSLKKLKYHLAGFDVVVKERTTPTAITKGSWGIEHTKASLKDDLKKLKGKSLVDNVVMKHTIDPEMLKIDVEPITPKLLNKKTAHSAYIKHTQEEATVLRDLVEQVKSKYPLDHSLESACRFLNLYLLTKKEPVNLGIHSFSDVPSSLSMIAVIQIVLGFGLRQLQAYDGDRSQLTNFVNKFLGTVKFGNDHVAKILGYGDYYSGNVTIHGLLQLGRTWNNLFFVGSSSSDDIFLLLCYTAYSNSDPLPNGQGSSFRINIIGELKRHVTQDSDSMNTPYFVTTLPFSHLLNQRNYKDALTQHVGMSNKRSYMHLIGLKSGNSFSSNADHASCQDYYAEYFGCIANIGRNRLLVGHQKAESAAILVQKLNILLVWLLCSNPLDEITAYRLWP
ncbi:hypothetical protein Tco_1165554, partial [Tanacetum coccineum]